MLLAFAGLPVGGSVATHLDPERAEAHGMDEKQGQVYTDTKGGVMGGCQVGPQSNQEET